MYSICTYTCIPMLYGKAMLAATRTTETSDEFRGRVKKQVASASASCGRSKAGSYGQSPY